MTGVKDIIDSIENRLRELNEEIGALNAARDVLDGHDSQAPRGRRRGATSETQTGPSQVASGAGRVKAAVEPAARRQPPLRGHRRQSLAHPLGGELARRPIGPLRLSRPASSSCCCRIPAD
jgi:hypothetical protein